MKTRQLIHTLLLALCVASFSLRSHADSFNIGISVGFAPPPLPVYVQPPCPEIGYIWTPGYWAYSDEYDDYYWVPGTWVYAPAPGLLWTPGYWAEREDGAYLWYPGYWAPHVGYYGGINYGYGYFGIGFVGGYWRDRDFYYNRAVANVEGFHGRNVYVRPVENRYGDERSSFNGREGVHARPTGPELVAQHEPHRGWTLPQQSHVLQARNTPVLRASTNQGRPPVAATPRPGVFAGRGIVGARPAFALQPHGSNYRGAGQGAGPASQAPRAIDNMRSPGVPMRSDRPTWAQPGGGAGPSAPYEPARRERQDNRVYPQALNSVAPAMHSAPPAVRSVPPAGAHSVQPAYGGSPAYGGPSAAAPRWTPPRNESRFEQRSPPAHQAPAPRLQGAPPPPQNDRGRREDSRDERQR